jgi:hypothetical protein
LWRWQNLVAAFNSSSSVVPHFAAIPASIIPAQLEVPSAMDTAHFCGRSGISSMMHEASRSIGSAMAAMAGGQAGS